MLQLNNVVWSGKLLGKLLLVYTWYTFGEIGLFRPLWNERCRTRTYFKYVFVIISNLIRFLWCVFV